MECGGTVIGHLVLRGWQNPLFLPQLLLCYLWCLLYLLSCEEKKKTVDRRAVTVRCTRRHKNNRLAPLPFFSSFLFTRIVGKHWLAAVKHKNLPSIPVHRLCFGPAHPAKISCVCQQKCQLCHAFVMVMCCTTFTGISHV